MENNKISIPKDKIRTMAKDIWDLKHKKSAPKSMPPVTAALKTQQPTPKMQIPTPKPEINPAPASPQMVPKPTTPQMQKETAIQQPTTKTPVLGQNKTQEVKNNDAYREPIE